MRVVKHMVWFGVCLATCFCLLLSFLRTSMPPTPPQEMTSFSERRTMLYQNMATDLEKHGPTFLAGGTTSQSLKLSDIFSQKDGLLQPILKPSDPAVRACVLYLDPHYAEHIFTVVRKVLDPYFPKGSAVWFQDPNMFHFSLFHASHHLEPVVAAPAEIDAEARQVESVARRTCELSIVLDKVVLTSTGVLLGCWQVRRFLVVIAASNAAEFLLHWIQVLNGTDPTVIRRELQMSLPRAPAKQLYDEVMLHTSFARLLGPPQTNGEGSPLRMLQQLVSKLNRELYHFEAVVREMWFVEELDVLALALKGRTKYRRYCLQCQSRES